MDGRRWENFQSIINIIFQDSFKVIAAIFSNGIYIVKISNKNTTAYYFNEFIADVNKYIKLKDYYKKKTMTVVLDNARVHKTSEVIHKISNTFENVTFIPPYTPQFVPVELFFGMIKSKIRSLVFDKTKNYSTEKLKEIIKAKIKENSQSNIIKCFVKTFNQLNKVLIT